MLDGFKEQRTGSSKVEHFSCLVSVRFRTQSGRSSHGGRPNRPRQMEERLHLLRPEFLSFPSHRPGRQITEGVLCQPAELFLRIRTSSKDAHRLCGKEAPSWIPSTQSESGYTYTEQAREGGRTNNVSNGHDLDHVLNKGESPPGDPPRRQRRQGREPKFKKRRNFSSLRRYPRPQTNPGSKPRTAYFVSLQCCFSGYGRAQERRIGIVRKRPPRGYLPPKVRVGTRTPSRHGMEVGRTMSPMVTTWTTY